MTKSLPNTDSSNDPLPMLIADFLDAEGRGQPLDRESWLAQHANHADSLREFLANHDRMRQSAPLASDGATLPPGYPALSEATLPLENGTAFRTDDVGVGERVRYFGDYELLEEIARGGMGVVYKAKQINLNRLVALKMILAGQLASQQDVQRFLTEAESAANLDHPRIVPIYEVGQHAGQHYFSMGYIDGQSLAQKLVDGPLAPRDAAEMLLKVCEGIAYAHERGVIHRDLKPANILLDRNEQPKVTDFGLAKKLGSDSNLTGTGQILGTPSYMAPEQASGKIDELGPLADIYSLGAILYCLLTGRPPFQAANPMDTLLQVLDKEPIQPRQLNSTIPVDLETICLKCLSKEPHRRYTTANELSQELGRFLRGEPIEARPVGRFEQSWRWCKRNPALSGSLAAAVACLILGATVSGIFGIVAIERSAAAIRSEAAARSEEAKAKEATAGAVAARVDTEAALANSLFQQSRAMLALGEPGFRRQALDALQQSTVLTKKVSGANASVRSDLPTIVNLRTVTLSALRRRDGYCLREWKATASSLSPDGRFAMVVDPPSIDYASGVATGRSPLPWISRSSPPSLDYASGVATRVTAFKPRILDLDSNQEIAAFPDTNTLWKPEVLVAVGPAAKQVALTDSSRRTIGVFAIPSFERIQTLQLDSKDDLDSTRLSSLQFSPDGRYLAAIASKELAKNLLLWDLSESPELPKKLMSISQSQVPMLRPTFRPDSLQLVCTSGEQEVTSWDLPDLRTRQSHIEQAIIGNASYTHDGMQFVFPTVTDKYSPAVAIQLVDADSGQLTRTIKTGKLTVGIGEITSSPDGRWLASGTLGGGCYVIDLQTGESTTLDDGGVPLNLQWLSDSRRLTAQYHTSIKCFEWTSGSIDRVVQVNDRQTANAGGTLNQFGNLTLSNHNRTAFIRLNSNSQMRIAHFDLSTGEVLRTFDLNRAGSAHFLSRIGLSPDDRWLTYRIGAGLLLWDLQKSVTEEPSVYQLNSFSSQVAFRESGPIASLAGQNSKKVVNLITGQSVADLDNDSKFVALSPRGTWMLTTSQPGTLSVPRLQRIGDPTAPALEISHSSTGSVSMPDVVFSPDERWMAILYPSGTGLSRMSLLVSTSVENVLMEGALWDLKNRSLHRKLRYVDLDGLWFSPDGKLMVTLTKNSLIELSRIDDGQVLVNIPISSKRRSGVDLNSATGLMQKFELAFTPDGKSMAFLDADHRHLRFVDLEIANRELATIGLEW